MDQELQLEVDEGMQGSRIDRLLSERFPEITRSKFQKLLRDGMVTASGRKVRSAYRVLHGDRIQVLVPAPEPLDLVPEDIPLHVVHEDDALLVVNKQAGLVVHPAAGNLRGTLVHALLFHCRDLAPGSGIGRPGIVHRLDKDTSGLLVVAKTERAHAKLSEALRARRIEREYRALVWGAPRADEGRVETPIGRSPTDRKRMAVRESGGKPALTRFRVLERLEFTTLLGVHLGTGRTHQIRVHLSSITHPILGDATYGGGKTRLTRLPAGLRVLASKALDRMRRPALHAVRLSFRHPETGEEMRFESELPDDFAETLAILRRPLAGVRT